MMGNARPSRLTAAAGTGISRDLLPSINVIFLIEGRTLQNIVELSLIHVVLLDQTFVHCPIFLTAGR